LSKRDGWKYFGAGAPGNMAEPQITSCTPTVPSDHCCFAPHRRVAMLLARCPAVVRTSAAPDRLATVQSSLSGLKSNSP
jgi:hypothetical protein